MAYIPREIKDRVAVGDDIFIVEDLGDNRVRLIPAPTHVLEVGTPVNKALLQPMENHMGDVANPHATTKAQVGLGNVDNVKQASKSEFDAHVNLTAAHSATSTATANRIIIRDSAGRAKVAAPSASDDIARKAEVDAVSSALNTHKDATSGIHGATSSATANRIIIRDSAGRAKVAAPSASNDIARKAEVDAVSSALNTRKITAGNGLTGGGNLSADRTIAMGTPSTITATTSNSVTSTSHTHALSGIARIATGSYTGNGVDGRLISVGFTPKCVILGDLARGTHDVVLPQHSDYPSIVSGGFVTAGSAPSRGNYDGYSYGWVAFA